MASPRKTRTQAKKESPDARELLVLELQSIHSAEIQLGRVLPRLSKAAQARALHEMFDERLAEGVRVTRAVETALDDLEETPGRKKNIAAEGLVSDTREHLQEIDAGPALDEMLIASMQKTEHYCIAAWGTAKALAAALGHGDAANSMDRAIREGTEFDQRLTLLAEKEVIPELAPQDLKLSGSTQTPLTRAARWLVE